MHTYELLIEELIDSGLDEVDVLRDIIYQLDEEDRIIDIIINIATANQIDIDDRFN